MWALYRTLIGFAIFAILIFIAGAVEYVHFEPFNSSPSPQAKVVGVYTYDAATNSTSGQPRTSFARNEQFAAVVDWSGLPDTITVEAVWYDSFENVVGKVGPDTPSELREQTVIPAEVPQGLKYHLPGEYVFAIERLDNGRPVEVLGRQLVYVERG